MNILKYNGNSALTLAALYGNTRCVTALLQAGTDVNVVNKYGNTALTYSSRDGELENVKLLLNAGADVNKQNNDWDTSLTLAAYGGHNETVKILIAAGADVNRKNYNGGTALMRASRYRNRLCIKTLIEAGADVNIANPHTVKGLNYLYQNKVYGMKYLKMSLAAGVDVNTINKYERNIDSDLEQLFFTVGEKIFMNYIELRLSLLCRNVIRM